MRLHDKIKQIIVTTDYKIVSRCAIVHHAHLHTSGVTTGKVSGIGRVKLFKDGIWFVMDAPKNAA